MKINKSLIINFLLGASPFIAFLMVWVIFYEFRIVPHWILSHPLDVLDKTREIAFNGTLLSLVGNSLVNAFVAFVLALVFSLLIGVAVGFNVWAKKIFLPFISFLYPIPSLAWLPLLIMIFGFSRTTIWIIVGASAFFKMVFSVINGIRNINRNILWAARNMGYSKWGIIFKVALPATFPQLMAGIRVGFGSSWRSLIGAEIIMPLSGGLGAYIAQSQTQFRFDQVIAGILVIAVISYAIEKLFFEKLEERTLVRYGIMRH